MIVLSNSILGSKSVERATIQSDGDLPVDAEGANLPPAARFLLRLHRPRRLSLSPGGAVTPSNGRGDGA